jgi:heptosyltransferase II
VREPRFLIIKIAALGDIAVASALLERIRSVHPDAHVTWLVGTKGADLVRLFGGVDEVLTVDEERLLVGSLSQRLLGVSGVWRQLVARRFDHVLLLHADRRYRILTLPLAFSRVSALEHGVLPMLDRSRADEYARLLDGQESRGPITGHYRLSDIRDQLPKPDGRPPSRAIVFAPGGARNVLRDDALRRWPVENYRELARRLLAADYEVVLIGDGGDVGVREQFQGLEVTDRIGTLSLTEALCVLRDARIVVTHDTGPLHFARLVRTPVIALFGPTDPRHVVGHDMTIVALWGGADLACRPCYDGRDYAACTNNLCIKEVSVDSVYDAVVSHASMEGAARDDNKHPTLA